MIDVFKVNQKTGGQVPESQWESVKAKLQTIIDDGESDTSSVQLKELEVSVEVDISAHGLRLAHCHIGVSAPNILVSYKTNYTSLLTESTRRYLRGLRDHASHPWEMNCTRGLY